MKKFLLLLCLFPLLASCAKTVVVLVPDDDGKVGQVAVSTASSEAVLTDSNQYTGVTDKVGTVKVMAQNTQQQLFGSALAAAPQKPLSVLFYFKTGSAEFDPLFKDGLTDVAHRIKAWDHPHVSVIGHCDTMGDPAFNDKLALARAEAVRKLLEQNGVDPSLLKIYGHGANDPFIPTGPNVSEPQNRRVEVFVR